MGTNQAESIVLSPLEKDAVGEVMNISMGAAATAVSQMLDRQVEITVPNVDIRKVSEVSYENYEPALLVKIVYTSGITGSNVMVFRQHDMQMILNTMMGIPDPPSDDFVFDELSISAACEVMNQMMGSSATALAEFLGKTIDISTPQAIVMKDESAFRNAIELPSDAQLAVITFRLTIKDMLESEFISVLAADLAKEMIAQFISGGEVTAQAYDAPPADSPPAAPLGAAPTAQAPAAPNVPPLPPPAAPSPAAGPAAPYAQPYPPPYPGAYPGGAYAPPPPEYAAPPPHYAYAPPPPAVEVRPVEFPEFPHAGYADGVPVMGNNMDLIMNVPLDVSIEIGTTKRKIRDIMNFTAGTVVELDKQAGAPIDIVVNGQLIAHGDVVVIDDNFGVRITEIVGTKELLNSLEH